MTERQDYQQLELFSAQNKDGVYSQALPRRGFFRHIRSYEKPILFFVAVVICGLVCFSVGVEKGKAILRQQTSAPVAPAARQIPPVPLSAEAAIIPVDNLQRQEPKSALAFTIQVASFQDRGAARKEAQALKKKGLTPLLSSKGKYITLCVGNFSTREMAQSMSLQLKKQYKDCFIRRL